MLPFYCLRYVLALYKEPSNLFITFCLQVPMVAAAGGDSSSQHVQQLQQEQLTQLVSEGIDLLRLRQLAASAAVPQPQAALPPAARTFRVSLGVAYDEAFYRYFQQ